MTCPILVLQRLNKALMYVIEAPVAHNYNLISMSACVQQVVDDLLRVVFYFYYCRRSLGHFR